MPPLPIAQPDGPEIRRLIRERGYSVTDFARKIGRHPQSIWVITGRSDKPPASQKFIRQIARELGVRPCDISDMPDDGETAEAGTAGRESGLAIPPGLAAAIREYIDAQLKGGGKAA